MNSIHLQSGDEKKLIQFLENVPTIWWNNNEKIILQFKKTYNKKIKLLKILTNMAFDVIGIINDYLIDSFEIEIIRDIRLMQKLEKDYNYYFYFFISSKNVNIDFKDYNFNYVFCIHLCHLNNNYEYKTVLLPGTHDNVLKYDMFGYSNNSEFQYNINQCDIQSLMPDRYQICDMLLFFNYYFSKNIFNITSTEIICKKINNNTYDLKNDSTGIKIRCIIKDHSQLKNIIWIFEILIPIIFKNSTNIKN